MNVTGHVEEPGWLTKEETTLLFANAARETNVFAAYQSFNNRSIRHSMRIPDDIWYAMEPDLKERVNALRAKVKAEREAKASLAEGSKPTPAVGIPAQCPTVNEIHNVANVPATPKEHVVSLQNLNSVLFDDYDDDDDTDDGLLDVRGYTVTTDEIVTVRAHFEYATTTMRNYLISDSGADSCCLGKQCHPVSYTGRHAILVGYNPEQTRSGKVPIVSAYIKVMSQMNIPIVLYVHEAPYMSDSDVTLLSEYQIREHGIVIDSVSKRHKSVNGTFGTQRMILSEYIHVPFVDRGGLLGCEILPRTEGDEDIYDVFEITRDLPWKPRQFRDDEEDQCITTQNLPTL